MPLCICHHAVVIIGLLLLDLLQFSAVVVQTSQNVASFGPEIEELVFVDHVYVDLLGDLHDCFDDLLAVKLRRICQGIAQLGSLSVRAFQIVNSTKRALQFPIVLQDSILISHRIHLHVPELGRHYIHIINRCRHIFSFNVEVHNLIVSRLDFFYFSSKA